MKKALMWIGGGVGVLLLGLIAAIAMQPSQVHVERSQVINATPSDVWPYVSDLRGFVMWSPWSERDPTQISEFSEPSSGVGAWYSWKGNKDVGSGKMTLTVVEPETKVVEDLEFFEPFAGKSDVAFLLEPAHEGGTKVTWTYDAPNDLMGRTMGLFMSMDKMLGGDFAKGLTKLQGLAEADATARIAKEAADAAAAEAAAAEAIADPAATPGTP